MDEFIEGERVSWEEEAVLGRASKSFSLLGPGISRGARKGDRKGMATR